MDDAQRLRIEYLWAVHQREYDLNQLAIAQYTHGRRRRRRGQRGRSMWIRPWIRRRRQFGLYDHLLVELRREDPISFVKFMRMPPVKHDEIFERVRHRTTKQYIWFREPLEPGLKLAWTLRHLASGTKYSDLKFGWRVPQNTIPIVVREVCQAIIDEYMDEVMTCPTTPDEWREIADCFYKKWNFPHICAAVDGKHVACRCPPSSGSTYHNYKGFYSIDLLAAVDADYKFIWADIGGMGAASDAQIYNQSELKEYIDDGSIGFPDPEPLPHDTQDVPFFLICDDAFALDPHMMKPYGHRGLSHDERIFNYRLSRARRVVENAFGILATRFQVLLTTMNQRPFTVRLIVKACMVLHNLMRIRYPGLQNAQLDLAEGHNRPFTAGSWRDGKKLEDAHVAQGNNRLSKEGKNRGILSNTGLTSLLVTFPGRIG